MEAAVIEKETKVKALAPIHISAVDPRTDPRWDATVRSFPGATAFHSAGWARVLADTYGYHPQYLVACRHHTTVGILPLMEVISPLTGPRGVSLPFTDFCPPLGRDPDVANALLARARELGRSRRWRYLDLRDFPLDAVHVPTHPFIEHTLALPHDPASIPAGFRPEARRAIRKAEKEGLTGECSTTIDAVRDYYRLHCLTRRRHGLPVQSFAFFRNIHTHLLTQGMGFVTLVRAREQVVAGSVFLTFGGHAMYKFGASDPAQMSLRGNHLAMWNGIRSCAEQGYTRLSLGKTSPEQDGLRRFKSSYGTTEQTRHYLRWDAKNDAWTRPGDSRTGWHNHLFRHAPLPLLRLAGKLLYPHVG